MRRLEYARRFAAEDLGSAHVTDGRRSTGDFYVALCGAEEHWSAAVTEPLEVDRRPVCLVCRSREPRRVLRFPAPAPLGAA